MQLRSVKLFSIFFSLFLSLAVFSQDIPALTMDGSRDLPALTRAKQQILLTSLRRNSGPYGKNLVAYYLPKNDPALAMINPEMLDLLYEMSAHQAQANCYWASMLGKGVVQLPERYMDMPEYEHLLATHFSKRQSRDVFFPGDVLRLKRSRGNMDTHSVIYLGTLKDHPYTRLVLTKNGPIEGPYLIMELSDLTTKIYPSSIVAGVYYLD